jgi:hypothetical protein
MLEILHIITTLVPEVYFSSPLHNENNKNKPLEPGYIITGGSRYFFTNIYLSFGCERKVTVLTLFLILNFLMFPSVSKRMNIVIVV